MSKNSIFISSEWLLPAVKAGGPAKSVYLLVKAILEQGAEVKLVSSGKDLDGSELNQNDLNQYGKIIQLQADSFVDILKFATKNIKQSELVYLNDFYSIKYNLLLFLVAKIYGKKVVLAPRGMLTHGALAIKPEKKRKYISILKKIGYFKNVIFHFTAKPEAKEFHDMGIAIKSEIILANLSGRGKFINQNSTEKIKLKFVSRLSEKKNLHGLLEALAYLDNIKLEIYGEFEEELYEKLCNNLVQKLPTSVEVSFFGSYLPKDLERIFSKPSVFILPTKNENYGHSIVEALSYGIPVFISKYTPWTDIEKKGGGAILDIDTTQNLAKSLSKALDASNSSYEDQRRLAYEYFQERVFNQELPQSYFKAFFE